VNCGSLTRLMLDDAADRGVTVHCNQRVQDLQRETDGRWAVTVRDTVSGERRTVRTRFVFVGAGGAALPLLQKSGIAEAKGYGGFPVGGQFLRSANPAVTAAHQAKVYGFPPLGAPPMSAPHLDTRFINGKQWLLFGPFAGWTPKFLKQGHFTDLPLSVKPNNVASMVSVGLTQMSLVSYLVSQLMLSETDRVDMLRDFAPTAVDADWDLSVAGQRVQVIKPGNGKGGTLEFGTTVLTAADGSIAGLLGASPGASTAVPAMLEVMERCFADRYSTAWQSKLKDMIPSLGTVLSDNPALYDEVWAWGTKVLGLGSDSTTRDSEPVTVP
jgi:malate dehydrogenase (quinone)